MSKQVIAIIGSKGLMAEYGGVERLVHQICAQLHERYHFIVYGLKSYGTNESLALPDVERVDFRIVRIAFIDMLIYSCLATIHALFKGVNIYYFHACGPGFFTILPSFFRKKVIWHFHGSDYNRSLTVMRRSHSLALKTLLVWTGEFLRYCFLRLGEYIAVRAADRVFIVSRTHYHRFVTRNSLRSSKFVYMPNFLSGFRRVGNGESPHHIHTDRFDQVIQGDYILTVSRLVPEKRIDVMINGFQELKADFPNLRLIIVGEGRDEHYLKDLAATESRIVFTGAVPCHEVFTFYEKALLFCLCSEVEGAPLTVLEAMEHGCPVLARAIPEMVEFGEECLFFFRADQDQAFVSELRATLLDPEERHIRVKKAYEYLHKEHDAHLILNQFRREFERLLPVGKKENQSGQVTNQV
ncbi:glycosyltransferase family 4 protein [bacterium]|nr:glycosyltransferase family 4 protein [bacterium]